MADSTPTDRPALWRLPPWMDPGFMLASSSADVRVQAMTLSVNLLIAQGNPRRWAIGFLCPIGAPESLQIAPWADVAGGAAWLVAPGDALFFNLFEHGPFILRSWHASTLGGYSIRVIETELQ